MHRSLVLATTLLASAATSISAAAKVQFVVVVPDANADQPKTIFLSCSADGWNEAGRPLERIAPGLYNGVFDFEPGIVLEYKFTRAGSWATVEKAADGQELPNRVLRIDPKLDEQVVVHQVARWADRAPPDGRRVEASGFASPAATGSVASTLTGDIRFHHAFHSPQLNNDRTIVVYLPPGYGTQGERYPVLYMLDGQNVFDAKTSFAGVEWAADETATKLIEAGQIPKLIIVGIYNNADRVAEYTPFRDAEHGGGNADAFLEFIVKTVKPFIDETYRTRPERQHTAIAGSSLGGLVSLHALYKHPDVFGGAGVISPALWWADGAMLKLAAEHKLRRPLRVWIDAGSEEGDRAAGASASRYVEACRKLTQTLESQGCQRDTDFRYEEISGGRHHEADWARRFDQVLTFLFREKQPSGHSAAPGRGLARARGSGYTALVSGCAAPPGMSQRGLGGVKDNERTEARQPESQRPGDECLGHPLDQRALPRAAPPGTHHLQPGPRPVAVPGPEPRRRGPARRGPGEGLPAGQGATRAARRRGRFSPQA